MEEKDIYQGLSKTQITKFKKEESACKTHCFCTEEEILSTVRDGKNIYNLNQHICEK